MAYLQKRDIFTDMKLQRYCNSKGYIMMSADKEMVTYKVDKDANAHCHIALREIAEKYAMYGYEALAGQNCRQEIREYFYKKYPKDKIPLFIKNNWRYFIEFARDELVSKMEELRNLQLISPENYREAEMDKISTILVLDSSVRQGRNGRFMMQGVSK